jgi:hypothetical protein
MTSGNENGTRYTIKEMGGSLLDALLLFYRLELFHVRQILCATARSLICDQIFKGNNRDLQTFDRNIDLVSIGLFEVNTADACDDVNSARAVANLKDNSFDREYRVPICRIQPRRSGAMPSSGWKHCQMQRARKRPCLWWLSDSRKPQRHTRLPEGT